MTTAALRTSGYDAIIIGTGQAGPALVRRLAASGATVAIIERGLFGGTCVNTGCIPTKTLIASAYAIHMARRAADFGVVVDGSVQADMARVKARKDTISGQSRAGVEESLQALENCTVYRGHARFVFGDGVSWSKVPLAVPSTLGGTALAQDAMHHAAS